MRTNCPTEDMLIQEARRLILDARKCVELSDADLSQEFLEYSSCYLSALVNWNKQMQDYVSACDADTMHSRSDMRDVIMLLDEANNQVLVVAEAHKDKLGEMIGDVHKKSKAIKTYIDPHPFRKSLTGHRKG